METTLTETSSSNACGFNNYTTTLKEFPIIAFSTGIPVEEYGVNFCGLRDSGVHPKLWFEKFKIKNYVYFEIKFLEIEK